MTSLTTQALWANSDIADAYGVSRGAISNWRKRADDFPQPVAGTSARPLFARDQVIAWMEARGYPQKTEAAHLGLWAALNSLRGELRAEQMGSLVLALACLRRICQLADAADKWTDLRDAPPQELHKRLRGLVYRHAQSLPDHLESADLVDLVDLDSFSGYERQPVSDHALATVIMALSNIKIEALAKAVDGVLNRVAKDQVRAGVEYGFVGSTTSKLLASLVPSDAAEQRITVYDPAIGVGSALMNAIDRGWTPGRVVGEDINTEALRVARQRFFLRGVQAELRAADVLLEDPDPTLQADIIFAEPPFGMALADRFNPIDRRWAYGLPPRSNSETAWLQHVIAHLAEGGRGYVLTGRNSLFASTSEPLRTNLVRNGCVEQIVGLPGKLLPHTSIPLALWVLTPPSKRSTVRFIDATDNPDDLDKISSWLQTHEAIDEVPSQVVYIADIIAADGDLSPSRWTEVSKQPGEVSEQYHDGRVALAQAIHDISGIIAEIHPVLAASENRVASVHDLRGLIDLKQGRSIKDPTDEELSLQVTIGNVHADDLPRVIGQEGHVSAELTKPMDVLVSARGDGVRAVLDTTGGHIVGSGVTRMRVRNREHLDPGYLAAVLSGSWNTRLQGGTFAGRGARHLEIPLIPLAEQLQVAAADRAIRQLTAMARTLNDSAQQVRQAMLDGLRYNIPLTSQDDL